MDARKKERLTSPFWEVFFSVLVLAGLAIVIFGFAGFGEQRTSSGSKAEIQMALITATLEAYNDEHGEYPGAHLKPFPDDASGMLLYQLMTGDGDDFLGGTRPSNGKIDEEEKSVKPRPPVDPVHDRHGFIHKDSDGNVIPELRDPWGNPWNYRPAIPGVTTSVRNSTYDLWSFGTDRSKSDEKRWTKNW